MLYHALTNREKYLLRKTKEFLQVDVIVTGIPDDGNFYQCYWCDMDSHSADSIIHSDQCELQEFNQLMDRLISDMEE